MLEFRPSAAAAGGTIEIEPSLGVVDIENAVGSRLMLVELGLAPPLLIAGRYRLSRLLGRGARGVVCQARDLHLDREVALKLYPAHEPGPVAREVRSEAQVLARLEHPNVVGVHDFGDASMSFEIDGAGPGRAVVVPCFFMVMEYVRGHSLRRWLATAPRDRGQILAAFAQAAQGLGHAHAAGIVHRDFKPENVMLDERGRVLVVDFGLASRRTGTTGPPTTKASMRWQPPSVVGTLEYMAPEARAGQASAASDQYSFAVSLHEALLGALPAVDARGVHRVEVERFPAAVGRVLARALAPESSARYSSMLELLGELPRRWDDQWRWRTLDGEPKPARRPPYLALGAIAALGLLGAGVALGAKLFGASDGVVAAVAAESSLGAGGGAGADVACLAAALTGRWRVDALDLWDYKLARRGVRGYYELELERASPSACTFQARLSKTGSSIRRFDQILVGDAPVHVEGPDASGRFELTGDFVIRDDGGSQHLRFDLFVVDEHMRGSYERMLTSPDGIERRSMLGPAYGERWGTPLPTLARVDEVPCAAQCNILCAGADATASCRRDRCARFEQRVDDCGPPSADFVDPYTTGKKLREFVDGTWRPASSGRACEELPAELAGSWTIWERSDAGELREWSVELEPRGCGLIGRAWAGRERHAVVVELDDDGRWLVRDRGDPDALLWALQGWDFAVGSAGGRRRGRLSARERR